MVQPTSMPESIRESPPEIEREPDAAPAGLDDESGVVADQDGDAAPSRPTAGADQDVTGGPGGGGVPGGAGSRPPR
jgi:hypothetical protein